MEKGDWDVLRKRFWGSAKAVLQSVSRFLKEKDKERFEDFLRYFLDVFEFREFEDFRQILKKFGKVKMVFVLFSINFWGFRVAIIIYM